MTEQDKIDEHIKDVHGIEEGATSLKPLQQIEVDTKLTFSLPSALDIELVGPDKRAQVVHSMYTRCVSRGIINKTSNKNTADLSESRSREFMIELEKNSTKTYFACFKMYLSVELEDIDINEDFTCKWGQLEQAFYNAIGKEQNIIRLSNFFDKDYKQFHSQPLELIIDQVDYHVN